MTGIDDPYEAPEHPELTFDQATRRRGGGVGDRRVGCATTSACPPDATLIGLGGICPI